MTDPGDTNGSQAVVAVDTVRSAKLPAPQLDVVETQTRAIGLIIPPHDIRVIIDKTADFVAKNGATLPHASSKCRPIDEARDDKAFSISHLQERRLSRKFLLNRAMTAGENSTS